MKKWDHDSIKRIVDAETSRPIRPGRKNGQPFWNTYATRFMYAPAFEFKEIKGSHSYRFSVKDVRGKVFVFTADSPYASLAPIWTELPAGPVFVDVDALDEKGEKIASAGHRSFYRNAPFDNTYPPKRRSYLETARMTYDYIFNLEGIKDMLNEDPDLEKYHLFCYPSKTHSALIEGMINYAEIEPAKKKEAMTIAVRAADYLIKTAIPAGQPLEFLPRTYEGEKEFAAKFDGQIMMLYPAYVGEAMIKLAAATGQKKYLDYAKVIGDQYLRHQLPNGSWYLNLRISDGKNPQNNLCMPANIYAFLENLSKASGDPKYARAAKPEVFDAYIKSFNWEGQFEDVEAMTKPYLNLTVHMPITIMLYLAERSKPDAERIAQMREIGYFCEDQFVVWKEPGWVWVSNPYKDRLEPNDDWGKYYDWHTPAALEQYRCYVPIDSAAARLILYFLKLYDLTKEPLYLLKARALGDSMTCLQGSDGRIPTWCQHFRDSKRDWINCMYATANHLKKLAEYDHIKL